MKYWDSSAIVPLILEEPSTNSMMKIYKEDPEMIVWWAAELECVSALARLEREELIDNNIFNASVRILNQLSNQWNEIQPVEQIKVYAKRLLRVHNLRTADSLQLAAAIMACDNHVSNLIFVSLDKRLSEAAAKEGFGCLPETDN